MRRLLALLVALSASACRDGAAPFTPEQFPADSLSSGHLTYNARGDHTPAWSLSADSVYFTSWSYPNLPPTKGMLLRLPRRGGIVTPILPALQLGQATPPWFSAPALSPDGSTLAFFQITDEREHEFDSVTCPFPLGPDGLPIAIDTFATGSNLQAAVLRVRRTSSVSSTDDAQLAVTFAGRTSDGIGGITNVAYPFQRLFDGEGVPFFRASWSPDGKRVVFSDGSQLRLWTVGQATSTVLAGTDDGILPAWSPDGNWIAFSKPFKGRTEKFSCQGWRIGAVKPAALFSRTSYTPLTRENAQLFIVHADGTGLKNLGEGEAPAWLPDNRTVVAHRANNLYTISVESGAATLIPNTLDAFEPAVSRDGHYLAFARRKEVGVGAGEPNSRGQYNIWVASF